VLHHWQIGHDDEREGTPLRVRVVHPSLIEDLIRFLAEQGCQADRVGEDELDVICVSSVRHDAAREELEHYLELWEHTGPGAQAEVVGD
jgi:hypothetical protein